MHLTPLGKLAIVLAGVGVGIVIARWIIIGHFIIKYW